MRLTDNKIFAVVITHNGSKTIIDCINSLKNSKAKVDIVVIDNASTDETPLLIQSFSDIRLIQLKKNIGFGQANNIGFEYALENNADFVFLLNQDAEVEPDTIGKLVETAKEIPEFGVLSPLHLNADGTAIDTKFNKYVFRGNENYYNDLLLNNIQTVYELPFVNAAAWLLTSKCIEIVGKFNPFFFMYGEDNEYCYRILQNGFKIGIVPGSRIYHSRTVNNAVNSLWEEVYTKANRDSVTPMVGLITTKKNYFKAIIFWLIDHHAKMLKLIINRAWKELAIVLLSGGKILYNLPKIRNIRKQLPLNKQG